MKLNRVGLSDSAERLTVGTIALVAVGAAIADALGAFDHISWLVDHKLDFVILLLGVSAAFIVSHAVKVDSLKGTVEELLRVQNDLLSSSARIITGEDESYSEAVTILRQGCKTIFLMQRSSTLILGPEAQLPHELEFFDVLLSAISNGANVYHVISLEGIRAHLQRKERHFPRFEVARNHLTDDPSGLAQIRSGKRSINLKTVTNREGVKLDKQARMLIVEHADGSVEGLFAFDLGGQQMAIKISGTQLREYLMHALDFFRSDCRYVEYRELVESAFPVETM